MLKKLKNFLNHQRYQTLAILVISGILIALYSCQPKVSSINSPSSQVSREGLDTEVESFLLLAENRYNELGRQEEFRNLVFENAINYSKGVPINPIGLLTSIAGIFGIGATVDNVRRRKTESRLKAVIAEKSPE